MSNASKNKGDRAEREAVRVLALLAPDLLIATPRRKLGAGRQDDIGDLDVLIDAAVQVKNFADLGAAIRQAATGAAAQARRANLPFHLGMAPVRHARAGSVRWIASCLEWPDLGVQHDEVARFGTPSAAVAHLRNERLGVPRLRRIAVIERSGSDAIVVAPLEAWLDAYRDAHITTQLLPAPNGRGFAAQPNR